MTFEYLLAHGTLTEVCRSQINSFVCLFEVKSTHLFLDKGLKERLASEAILIFFK